MNKEAYNDDPVFYCKRCLSLNIKQMPFGMSKDYCDDCGATDIAETQIEEWKEMYRKKYGHDFIVKVEKKWPYWY